MIQRHPDETNSASGDSYPSTRLDKFCVAVGIVCLVALMVLELIHFDGSGYDFGFLALMFLAIVVRAAIGHTDAGLRPDDPPDITPAQRVNNAHRKSHR